MYLILRKGKSEDEKDEKCIGIIFVDCRSVYVINKVYGKSMVAS